MLRNKFIVEVDLIPIILYNDDLDCIEILCGGAEYCAHIVTLV